MVATIRISVFVWENRDCSYEIPSYVQFYWFLFSVHVFLKKGCCDAIMSYRWKNLLQVRVTSLYGLLLELFKVPSSFACLLSLMAKLVSKL